MSGVRAIGQSAPSSSSTKRAIGELRLIRSAFSYSLYDEGNIRLRTAVDGGALMDVGCYSVSGSRLFGGEAREGIWRSVVRTVRD